MFQNLAKMVGHPEMKMVGHPEMKMAGQPESLKSLRIS